MCCLFPLRIYTALKLKETFTLQCFPFVSPTNLHCSQTVIKWISDSFMFVSPTNLHCSQTVAASLAIVISLFPLRIYTALKHHIIHSCTALVCFPYEFTLLSNDIGTQNRIWIVCFPYEFTLLSNDINVFTFQRIVCFPYEFTLLSNINAETLEVIEFVSPTNLHCSQTDISTPSWATVFVSPTNLHCSQTVNKLIASLNEFVSPTNLHCSQTSNRPRIIVCKIPVFLHRSHHSPLY